MNSTRTKTRLALAGLCLLLTPGAARASGYGINDNSARVVGMGGAFTAVADSPGAIYANPAGIAQLPGLQLEVGLTLVAPSVTFTGLAPDAEHRVTVDTEAHLSGLPSLHATCRLHDRVAVGLGLYTPYGLTRQWPGAVTVGGKETGWWGRSLVRRVSLETLYLNPTVGVRLHERLYLGVGFAVALGSLTLERAVTLSADPADDVDLRMSGDDVAFGATAGVLIKVIPNLLNVGVGFRSGVAFTFEGSAAYTRGGSPAGVPAALRSQLADGPAAVELTTPHVASFGAAAFPARGLTVSFTLDVITWSAHDRLQITFTETDAHTSGEVEDWHNTLAVRLGAEYEIFSWLPVRLGFVFDQSPVPETTLGPDLPDGDRYVFNVGAGYRWRGLSVDLAYTYLFTGEVSTASTNALVGSYQVEAHGLGLSVGYRLEL